MTIDLSKFHGRHDIRSHLNAPWRDGGVIFATNGHYCIEIPDDGRDVPARTKAHPDVAALLAKHAATEWRGIPALPAAKSCSECHGTGEVRMSKCDECDDGTFDHGTHEYQCKECDGEGEVRDSSAEPKTCWYCDGFGEQINHEHRVVIDLNGYSPRYLRIISTLPGVMVSESGKDTPLLFKFDGGRGLVMPMRD